MASAAGLQVLEVCDERTAETVPVRVVYPADGEECEVRLGRYPASRPGRATGHRPRPARRRLARTGSSPFLHRRLAAHLARSGFVVALVEHPRDNRDDRSLAGTAEILRTRPSHLRAVVDALGQRYDLTGAVGVVGHSLGGYTALALAGAGRRRSRTRPRTAGPRRCRSSRTPGCGPSSC